MTPENLKNVVEAAIFAASTPMKIEQILKLFEEDEQQPDKDAIREALAGIEADYQGRGIELKEVASGFRFQVVAENAKWIGRLFEEKPPRYTRATLETLAIMAYRQPITRGEIEDIRGVSVSTNIIKSLHERDWIRVVGHRDAPGKPALYATTKEFLDYFNLKSLEELPLLSEIKDFDDIDIDKEFEEGDVKSIAELASDVIDETDDVDQMLEEESGETIEEMIAAANAAFEAAEAVVEDITEKERHSEESPSGELGVGDNDEEILSEEAADITSENEVVSNDDVTLDDEETSRDAETIESTQQASTTVEYSEHEIEEKTLEEETS